MKHKRGKAKKSFTEEIKSVIKDFSRHLRDHFSHKKLTPIPVTAHRPKRHK